jgi:cytoskeleton protein RodZ
MTASDSTTRVISDSGDDIGPGQRLREARESAQLSLTEVASRMRLEPHVLQLLENDHYDRLHGPTFVRGYLSGYARLLDLPERPILEAYERHDHRPPALVSELGHKPEVHVSDFPVRMVTYVIAGLLVVLVVLWWQSRQPQIVAPERADAAAEAMPPASAAPPGSSESDEPPAASTDVSQATQPQVAPTPSLQTAQPAPTPAAQVIAESSEQQPPEAAMLETPATEIALNDAAPTQARTDIVGAARTAAVDLQAAQAPAADSASSGPTGGVGRQAQHALVAVPEAGGSVAESGNASNAADVEEEAASAPRPAPLRGSDRLAIQLARESWVEIYDRGGGRLYYSLASEGSEVVVEGAGPMRVLLGEIEGAAVAYNGEPFDLSRYQGRRVVRFTVGELSSTTTPAPAAAEEPLTRETPPPSAAEHENAVADAEDGLLVRAAEPGPGREERVPAPTGTSPQTALVGKQPDS